MKYKRLYLRLSDSEIQETISRFHFEDHSALIYSLLPKIYLWSKPECYYFYEDSCHEFVTVLVTLGQTLDQHNHEFQEREHFLEAHAMDCLSLSLLSQSYEKMREILHRERRQYVTELSFIKEEQIPTFVRKFRKKLSSDQIFPVKINEANALIPSKTVIFQCRLSPYYEKEEESCRMCENTECPFRKTGNLYSEIV